jgi:CheY-like chemotaxis protein
MADDAKTVVLVADDEPSTLAMLASHLRSKGYVVLEASDGDQAWELAHEHLPHLVVLDVMMPGMSGWEVCRKIREAVSLAHTGVVMLTGIGENLNEMTSPLYGADAHVDKPFEFSDLDRKLKETLAKRRAGALGRADDNDEPRVALGWDEPASNKNGKASGSVTDAPRPVAKAGPSKPRASAGAAPAKKSKKAAPAKAKNGAGAKVARALAPSTNGPRPQAPKKGKKPLRAKARPAPARTLKKPASAKTQQAAPPKAKKPARAKAKAQRAPSRAPTRAPRAKAKKARPAKTRKA